MENYLKTYDNLDKRIIYTFDKCGGGIGDYLKFFMYLLDFCIKYDIKICYLENDIYNEKYIKLKYEKMYITRKELIGININYITHINEIENTEKGKTYIIQNMGLFYDTINYNNLIYPLQDLFYFSEEVIKNAEITNINNMNYISIHVRLGDKFLETDKSYVNCKEDVRRYNEERLFNFIEENSEKNILFFSDNNSYKLKLKNKFNNIIITDYEIGHTGLANITEKQALNAMTEFYLMTNSEHIYKTSNSGFSTMASKFKNIPVTNI